MFEEMWAALDQSAQSADQDRFLFANLVKDLRLNDAGFAVFSTAVHPDIVDLFTLWYREYGNQPVGERPFVDAYGRALKIRDSYRSLWLLGFPNLGMPEAHCGGWVSFFKFRARSGKDISVRVTEEAAAAFIREECKRKRMVWVACLNTLRMYIEQAPPAPNGYRDFDALGDRLGLGRYWDTPDMKVVALKMSIGPGDPLVRVPTFFDACGYPYFRPVTRPWLERHCTGCTCAIDNPVGDGVAELVVWVGSEDPPVHLAATGSKSDECEVLLDKSGEPFVFVIQSRRNLGSYDIIRP
jgi:hypothetical protein